MQGDTGCRAMLEHFLRDEHVAYQLEHHPLAYTARSVAASEHVSPRRVAKTVIVMADGQLAMVVVRASQELDMPHLSGALGVAHVRLATEDEFGPRFPNCELGAMPALGNLYGLPVFVDASLEEFETIRFEAGTYTDTICMRFADFVRLVHPTILHVAQPHERASVLV